MSTLVQAASIDSYISGQATTTNYGTDLGLACRLIMVGGFKVQWERTIFNFDLSSIPAGSTINSISLALEVWGVDASAAVKLQRCTRPATWTEMGVTWLKYDGTNNWTNAGGDRDLTVTVTGTFPSGTGTWTIPTSANFVTIAQDAIDNRSGILSLILFLSDESSSGSSRGGSMRSQEYDGGSAEPKVTVDYTAPTGQRRRGRFV